MADNVVLSTAVGTGDTVAADDIGGVKYARSKIVIGADGTNDGDVSSANPMPVSVATLPLPSGASTSAKQDAHATLIGAVDETAPVSDTASSGLNGRLQRIAQRITSLIALLPSSLSNGFFKISVQETSVTQPVSGTVTANAGSGTLAVSLASVPSHAVTNAGTFATQVDGAALTSLQLIDDPVLTDDAAFTPATSKVMMAGFQADETATDSVDEGDAGAARMTLDRKQITTIQPHTAGGLSMSSTIGGASTNATVVKNGAGKVYELFLSNINASPVYFKLYNKATTPDENDTPVWRTMIPGNTAGGGVAKTFPMGLAFSTGISFRCVAGAADNSTTAVSASEQMFNVGYF